LVKCTILNKLNAIMFSCFQHKYGLMDWFVSFLLFVAKFDTSCKFWYCVLISYSDLYITVVPIILHGSIPARPKMLIFQETWNYLALHTCVPVYLFNIQTINKTLLLQSGRSVGRQSA
jgi:hypothetical protein